MKVLGYTACPTRLLDALGGEAAYKQPNKPIGFEVVQ